MDAMKQQMNQHTVWSFEEVKKVSRTWSTFCVLILLHVLLFHSTNVLQVQRCCSVIWVAYEGIKVNHCQQDRLKWRKCLAVFSNTAHGVLRKWKLGLLSPQALEFRSLVDHVSADILEMANSRGSWTEHVSRSEQKVHGTASPRGPIAV